jgi:hypothetical protein
MVTEECKDTTDELYVLGFIAGLCNQEPRDELLLEGMLLYLHEAQYRPAKLNLKVHKQAAETKRVPTALFSENRFILDRFT